MDRLVFGIIPITTFYCFGCLNFGGQFNLVLRDQFHRFFHEMAQKCIDRKNEIDYQSVISKLENNQELLYQLLEYLHARGDGRDWNSSTSSFSIISRQTLNKISDSEILKKIIDNQSFNTGRAIGYEAIKKLNDEKMLYKIASDSLYIINYRINALEKITNQDLLFKFVHDVPDMYYRMLAFGELNTASLEKIAAEGTKDKALIIATNIKLHKSDWEKECSNKSPEYLSDVLVAVALVNVPRPSEESVASACRTLIRLGDKARIPELKKWLEYGDEKLAEDYLNSGNGELYKAAIEWARVHSYNIRSGYGSDRARWGSGR